MVVGYQCRGPASLRSRALEDDGAGEGDSHSAHGYDSIVQVELFLREVLIGNEHEPLRTPFVGKSGGHNENSLCARSENLRNVITHMAFAVERRPVVVPEPAVEQGTKVGSFQLTEPAVIARK